MRRAVHKATTVVGTLALVAGVVLAAPATANAAPATGAPVVVNEVYGGGGNSGATYQNDYIELINKGTAPVDLSTYSVQYKSAAGTSWSGVTPLTGVIQPGKTYLVKEGGGSTGSALPTPDDTGNVGISATTGVVALASTQSALTCLKAACATDPAVVDLVGFGTADTFLGAVAPAPSSTKAITRDASATNTLNNAADFTAAAPAPVACGPDCGAAPPTDQGSKTIAEIQGSGETSPFNGDIVSTKGIVTATYATGGFGGYVIQTPGTGGDLDFATHTASDGLFVYSPATAASVTQGDYVQVTGTVSEFAGLTELTVADGDMNKLDGAGVAVPKPISNQWPATDAQRESIESMLFAGSGTYTITNTYSTNQYGELGLAFGTTPLIQWTDQAKPGSPEAAAIKADNAARAVILDDGSSENFLTHGDDTPPYISQAKPMRVGEQVTFTDPVVVDYRNGSWKLQPTAPVVGGSPVVPDPDAYPATWTDTRTATPDAASIAKDGTPDIKAASFNVLNFFTMTGEKYVAAGRGTCSSYDDRAGNPITVNTCTGQGPRGAWNQASFERQYAKTVAAISASGANLIGLMEIENSVVVGEDKDTTLKFLVDQLNAKDGAGTWAYVAPATDALPDPSQQDVINCAIIYQPAAVTPVGDTMVLADQSGADQAFQKARTPIAQVFDPKGGGDPILFVVNHFKSKGSAATSRPGDKDSGDGQGASNQTRVEEAGALVTWLDTIKASAGVDAVVSVGDYNSYGQEDPMQVLYAAGYTDVEQHFDLHKFSYSFSGLSGSLDHALLNEAALARATGADIWNINSPESVALEYSRYNYAGTLYYQADPYASSDHDPVVVGLTKSAPGADRTVQVLGINDFHGRISANGQEAGAAVLAGAVQQLRGENPDTVFSAAGDLIGASTFESFIAHDKPTIDALNAAGLQVSAVGNHEFDQGYDDLIHRVMAPYDKDTNPYGGAEWKYLGANVKLKASGNPALDATWVKTMDNGVKVGFIGAVTEHLDELVSPAGIAGLEITDIADAVNTEADQLKAEGVNIVVMLVHEGSPKTDCPSVTDSSNDFGTIINRLDANVDAVISGHTHLTYNCMVDVPAWQQAGRAVTQRPVVSAGQYGYNLDQLLFTVSASGDVTAVKSNTVALTSKDASGAWKANFAADGTVGTIVSQAVANADVLGAKPLGDIDGPFNRAKLASGTENRGGESTLGNLVAEAQRWATESVTTGAAQIAFMNPGGLRADMVGNNADGYPAVLTYKQAATVQPFANTLVNMNLTGAQIKTVLEQQWQPAGSSRPFLRLGISKGFTYTYDPDAEAGSHILQMWLDGTPVAADATYSVTANSFLAAGGDNFLELGKGTDKKDTGQTDLQGMVDYMAAHAPTGSALPVDYTQRSVGVHFPNGDTVRAGQDVAFALSSLAFSSPADVKDTSVSVSLGSDELGTVTVDDTVGDAPDDETGTADVSVTIPAGTPAGPTQLTVRGNKTGTTTTVTVQVRPATFPDVDDRNPFAADIQWLVDNGIAQGYQDGTFRPLATVTRQSMAGFLFRLLNPDTDAPACDPQDTRLFSDVTASNPFCGEIEALAAEGVVNGFGGGTYGPGLAMSRQATTALLFRIANAGSAKPTCSGTQRAFSDVTVSNPFCGEIEWAAEQGLVLGYLDGSFKPAGVLTRQAMAGLLHRFVAE